MGVGGAPPRGGRESPGPPGRPPRDTEPQQRRGRCRGCFWGRAGGGSGGHSRCLPHTYWENRRPWGGEERGCFCVRRKGRVFQKGGGRRNGGWPPFHRWVSARARSRWCRLRQTRGL